MTPRRDAAAGDRRRATVSAGDRFGMLTVLEPAVGKRTKVRCRCHCGTETTPRVDNLRPGRTTSCGCARGRPGGVSDARVSPGDVFGRLTVLEPAVGIYAKVRCLCKCGTETTPRVNALRQGRAASCGCARRRAHTTLDPHGCDVLDEEHLDRHGHAPNGIYRPHFCAHFGLTPDDIEGQHLHHVCLNGACINPTHLVPLDEPTHQAVHAELRGLDAEALAERRDELLAAIDAGEPSARWAMAA